MGSPGSANGRRGDYVRIPEEAEVASKGEGDAAAAVKAAAAAECPRVLRCSAIRWWAKVAVLGIFLAGAGAAAVVFLGPLLIKKVRVFALHLLPPLSAGASFEGIVCITDRAGSPREREIFPITYQFCSRVVCRIVGCDAVSICAGVLGYLLIHLVCLW
jgi:hypothetical protein